MARPFPSPGETYLIALSSGAGLLGWHQNDQGALGMASRLDGDPWAMHPSNAAPAFDVYIDRTASVVPEPTSAVLLATGLAGAAGVAGGGRASRGAGGAARSTAEPVTEVEISRPLRTRRDP